MKWCLLIVLAVTAIAGRARAAYLTTITINGSISGDWDVTGTDYDLYSFTDINENGSNGTAVIADAHDIQKIYIANDATYFYFGVSTYANLSGDNQFHIYVDTQDNTTDGGAFQSDDYVIEADYTGTTCGGLTVARADGNGSTTNVGCRTSGRNGVNNTAAATNFMEGRIPLTALFPSGVPANGNIKVGIHVELPTTTNGTYDVSPGKPIPSFITYNNTTTLVPTFARVRRMVAEASHLGVTVRWHTSSEYFSAGTWVVRAVGDVWQPVHTAPAAIQNSEIGGDYEIVDRDGHPGDEYALVEVDSRTLINVFGPTTAVEPKQATSTTLTRLRSTADQTTLRTTAMAARLSDRASTLRTRLAKVLGAAPRTAAAMAVDVDVTREGLYAVCDSDASRLGAFPSSVSLRGNAVRAFSITTPCTGLGFYAAAPSSPYAPFDVYRVALASTRNASVIEPPSSTPQSATTDASLTAQLTPRRFLDFRDGVANRYFWSFASRDRSTPVALPSFSGTADLTLAVHPLATVESHTVVVSTDHEVGRATVGGGWTTVSLPGLDLAEATSLSFSADVDPSVIETLLIADASLRYRGSPKATEGTSHFETSSSGWVAVQDGSGRAFDVSDPLLPYLLTSAPLSSGTGLAVEVDQSSHTVFVGSFTRATPVPVAHDSQIDDVTTEADYLVLAPQALVDTAHELVALREEYGLTGTVISYDAVYARFSGSNIDPAAVPALLDWAATTWRTPPRYVVLIGSATTDPYGYTGTQRANDAPLVSSLDPTFTYRRFSDRELVKARDVAVGRIPTSDAAELGRYIDKVRAYEAASPAGRWTLIAGNQSSVSDPDFAVLTDGIGAGVTDRLVDTLASATTDELVSAWAKSDVIVYAGHGDVEAWADDLLASDTAPSLATARPPVTLSAACMDGMTTSGSGGLAWSLVSADATHGSIAAIAPSSVVEPIKASAFLSRVAKSITSGSATTWGEAWLQAQSHETTSAALTMVFIGDPALSP